MLQQSLIRNHDDRHLVQTSCGVLVINPFKQILLGHVTDKGHWDIPKGRQKIVESTLEAAIRELEEETSLQFAASSFQELGCFAYRPGKRLHLYKVYVPDGSIRLETLTCTDFLPRPPGSKPVLAMDRFCWATRAELPILCLPRLAERLRLLEW